MASSSLLLAPPLPFFLSRVPPRQQAPLLVVLHLFLFLIAMSPDKSCVKFAFGTHFSVTTTEQCAEALALPPQHVAHACVHFWQQSGDHRQYQQRFN
mmetsp:Transcript_73270/g.145765  ORF Transcript_73270/g.145765 Transcript_73270/m.145765 type:complete len:97 (+) Transcript_73270:1315-1605(+)